MQFTQIREKRTKLLNSGRNNTESKQENYITTKDVDSNYALVLSFEQSS
jgi:hypothetical protein